MSVVNKKRRRNKGTEREEVAGKKPNYSDNENDDEEDIFDEDNEYKLIQKINEEELMKEVVLPLIESAKIFKEMDIVTEDLANSFGKYKSKIPKTKKIITPGYWGVLDLTRESLYGVKDLEDSLLKNVTEIFSKKLNWNPSPAPEVLQKYFENNCIDNIDGTYKELDIKIKYIKSNMKYFSLPMTEEELKMSIIFPFYRGVIGNNFIRDRWGEIVTKSTSDARNENNDPFKKSRIGRKVDMLGMLTRGSVKAEILFGEVSGGIDSSGLPAASRKKRFLDKVKLSIIMRDSLNSMLKGWKNINDDERRRLIIYGWTQYGFEINIYAMQWYENGIYLFGILDKTMIPSSDNDCLLFEELYCVLRELEVKLFETEEVIKDLNSTNMRGKRRKLSECNSPNLNEVRTP